MRNLYDSLPDALQVAGREFPITTDFRDWLRFDAMLQDPALTEANMLYTMLLFFEPDKDGVTRFPEAINEAIDALIWFYRCGEEAPKSNAASGNSCGPAYDFSQDAKYIYAGFMQAYGINLYTVDLHWWEFCALVGGLTDDTLFGRIVNIRTRDTAGMGQKERQQHEKILRLVALDQRQARPLSLAERDRQVVERVRRRAQSIG